MYSPVDVNPPRGEAGQGMRIRLFEKHYGQMPQCGLENWVSIIKDFWSNVLNIRDSFDEQMSTPGASVFTQIMF